MKNPLDIPRMFLAQQRFPRPKVDDIPKAVHSELAQVLPKDRLSSGAEVGITVGSRGISSIAETARAAVDFFKSQGLRPFIIPAMGSHAGATAEGQKALIARYGVSEGTMGCRIRAEMKTRSLGRTDDDLEVFVAEVAMQADGVLLLNRVKPHTDFKGPIESGLTKMCAIGLGKLDGAKSYHRRIFDLGLGAAVRSAAEKVVASGKILGGLAILENAYHEVARIAAVPVQSLFADEERLLDEARGLIGRLPFDELDLLICDRMGKNISGSGLDTNVIGRNCHGYIQGKPWMEGMPVIDRIFVRTLCQESNGNGVGMGLVDFSTSRFMKQVNPQVTLMNALTACAPSGARPPIILQNDQVAIATALKTCRPRATGHRVAFIRDTLSVDNVYLSEALLDDARGHPNLTIVTDPEPLGFDDDGWLQSPFEAR